MALHFADPPPVSSNGPCSRAGRCLFERPALIALVFAGLFWLLRSQTYAGDGDQLVRMIEAGKWLVQTELLSQAILQGAYQLLHPLGWDGLSVLNLVSCLAGGAAVAVVILFMRDHAGADPLWGLGLFCSTGFLILCAGHTEYYTLFLATLLLYGYMGTLYLRRRVSILWVALAFSLAFWMHMGILFALPSLVVLPVLRDAKRLGAAQSLLLQAKPLAWGILPVLMAYGLKEFHDVLGLKIQGLSPTVNFVPVLSEPGSGQYYALFDFGHWIDIAYAWAMRSWLLWPMVFICVGLFGCRTLWRTDRLFLLIYNLCFMFFILTWHPNLGMQQDWDLFSIEAVPTLLLAMTYLPEWHRSGARRWVLVIAMAASISIVLHEVVERADLQNRGYGRAQVVLEAPTDSYTLTFDGHAKPLGSIPLREGHYPVKWIDRQHRTKQDAYAVIVPNHATRLLIQNLPQENRENQPR